MTTIERLATACEKTIAADEAAMKALAAIGWNDLGPDVLATMRELRDSLAAYRAEQAELDKPIDEEWLRTVQPILEAWWDDLVHFGDGFSVDYISAPMRFLIEGAEIAIDVESRGQLLDLLTSLGIPAETKKAGE